MDYTQLATLAAILRSGSFEGAAAELGLTQSAVSQRLKALEERIGAQLVHRAQPCSGTDAGRRLAVHADNVALLEHALDDDLRALSPRPQTRIRVAVNADSLATWFVNAMAMLPDHLFDLVVDDQDFSADWLRRGEVMAAVTALESPAPGCDCRPLGTLEYTATSSPSYMARHFPDRITPEAMARAPMLLFDQKDHLQKHWMKRYLGKVFTPPHHGLPSSTAFVEASLHGLGWGMNPTALVKDHLRAGTLVPLLPNAPYETPLFWQTPRLLGTALAPITQAVRKAARDVLAPPQKKTAP